MGNNIKSRNFIKTRIYDFVNEQFDDNENMKKLILKALDEAFTMLDTDRKSQIYDILAELNIKKCMTIINVTHDMDETLYGKDVILLDEEFSKTERDEKGFGEMSEVEKQINETVKERIDQGQKDYYLREKMNVIREELGDTVAQDEDAAKIRKRLAENPYPDYIKKKVSVTTQIGDNMKMWKTRK